MVRQNGVCLYAPCMTKWLGKFGGAFDRQTTPPPPTREPALFSSQRQTPLPVQKNTRILSFCAFLVFAFLFRRPQTFPTAQLYRGFQFADPIQALLGDQMFPGNRCALLFLRKILESTCVFLFRTRIPGRGFMTPRFKISVWFHSGWEFAIRFVGQVRQEDAEGRPSIRRHE